MNLLLLSKLFILGVVCISFLDEAEGNTAGMDVWILRNNFNFDFSKKSFRVKFVTYYNSAKVSVKRCSTILLPSSFTNAYVQTCNCCVCVRTNINTIKSFFQSLQH